MIGVRREDKNDHERRTPLTPEQVSGITAGGVAVVVQPSPGRAFKDASYQAAGATLSEDLSRCELVLGIKEMPVDQLSQGKAYAFFSHTIKGQPHNMPLLQRLLDQRCTLIDYERIVDEQDRRLIFFGRHAGCAGMIDTLWALGRKFRLDGIPSIFEDVRPAYEYDGLDDAKRHLDEIAESIRQDGIPDGMHPLICGFTGTGNVSGGAFEVYDRLPVREVSPDEMAALDTTADRHFVYKAVFDLPDRYRRKDGAPVTLRGLIDEPEAFENAMLPYLPKMTALVNGMFWAPALPRIVTIEELRELWNRGTPRRLKLISDISCDLDGAIEATVKATPSDDPVYVYDLQRNAAIDGFEGDGPVILAVDNLPAELPREASAAFGKALAPFAMALAACDWSRPLDQLALPPEICRAVITHQGRLAPSYAYLQEFLDASSS